MERPKEKAKEKEKERAKERTKKRSKREFLVACIFSSKIPSHEVDLDLV